MIGRIPPKFFLSPTFRLIFWSFFLFATANGIFAKCSDSGSPLGFLNQFDGSASNSSKIPLILVHGIHGTKHHESVATIKTGAGNEYWNEFISKIWNADKSLSGKYDLYIFKYCSDRESSLQISKALGNEIERTIPGRRHVIVAHSMGGLIAKSYMAGFRYTSGVWKDKKAAEMVLRLITLATPHHGTPGANHFNTVEPYTKLGWENAVQLAQKAYWGEFKDNTRCDIISDSTCPNRSDLRWSNFDGSFSKSIPSYDDNVFITYLNREFPVFNNQLIVYAGFLKPATWSRTKASTLLIRKNMPNARKLEIANDIIVNGFDRRFGDTDGMVPYKSGLNCSPEPIITSTMSGAICFEKNLVRRFEPGNFSIPNASLSSTSSIIVRNSVRGYDHEDLYTHRDVLKILRFDLCETIIKCNEPPNTVPVTPSPNPVVVSQVPTMFLLDVSGSMNDNNKIGQAQAAGVSAVREMKKNRQSGASGSSVAISTFGGQCGISGIRQILPYTANLDEAETTFRSRISRPDGMTPLYTAIGESVTRMRGLLASNTGRKEGRIIVLSDGEDTCSGQIRPQGVYSRGSGTVYQNINFMTIGFDVPAGSKAERDLQYLASVSGGSYFPANDAVQLSRAFEKTIRVYVPKTHANMNADFQRGVQAIINRDYKSALHIWTIYVRAKPSDPLGLYNLALTFEALKLYKSATEKYQEYLSIASSTPDRGAIETKVRDMREEYLAQLDYYIRLIASDQAYLKAFWQSIFNRTSFDLASEFDGFVSEKRDFYVNLPQILEIDARWLANDAKDIASSIDTVARRRGLASFDRDALSLLTLPIGLMDDLIERLNRHRAAM